MYHGGPEFGRAEAAEENPVIFLIRRLIRLIKRRKQTY